MLHAPRTLFVFSTPIASERQLLVTGCGRSGTRFTAELLRRCGVGVRHEGIGRDGAVSWPMAVATRATPWGPGRAGFSFKHRFHQVREPLATIGSLQTFAETSWRYAAQHIDCSLHDPPLLRAAKYWRRWNERAEAISHWRFRLEDLDDVLPELLQRAGFCPHEAPRRLGPAINSRADRYRPIEWADIAALDHRLAHDLREQAARYGYPT